MILGTARGTGFSEHACLGRGNVATIPQSQRFTNPSSIMESICHHLWNSCDKTLLQDLQGRWSRSHWRLRGCAFFQRPAPCPPSSSVPHHTSCLPVAQSMLSADSWACFIEARRQALFGGQASSEPLCAHKSWHNVGWAGSSRQWIALHNWPLSLCQSGCRSSIPEPLRSLPRTALEEAAPASALSVLLPLTPPGLGSAAVLHQTLPVASPLQGHCRPVS